MRSEHQLVFDYLSKLGYPLPAIRLALLRLMGISQQELGVTLGISKANLGAYMLGKRTGKRGADRVQDRIAEFFGIPADKLFADQRRRRQVKRGDRERRERNALIRRLAVQGYTQKQVASRVGLSQAHISRILSQENNIWSTTLRPKEGNLYV